MSSSGKWIWRRETPRERLERELNETIRESIEQMCVRAHKIMAQHKLSRSHQMSIPNAIVEKALDAAFYSKSTSTFAQMHAALDAVLPDLTAAAVSDALKEALPPCGCVGACEMAPMIGPSYYGRVCEIYLNSIAAIRARSKP